MPTKLYKSEHLQRPTNANKIYAPCVISFVFKTIDRNLELIILLLETRRTCFLFPLEKTIRKWKEKLWNVITMWTSCASQVCFIELQKYSFEREVLMSSVNLQL